MDSERSVLLCVMLCAITVVASSNLEPHTRNITLSITSCKSDPGHTQVTMDISAENFEPKEKLHVSVDVNHHSAVHENTEIVSTSTTTTAASGDLVNPTKNGYQIVNGLGYYKMYTIPLIWEDARDRCIQDGAHLIVINSDQEADVIRTYFARKPKLVNATSEFYVHIGFHDRYSEGKYETVLGGLLSETGYIKWSSGEPTGNRIENCGITNGDAIMYDNFCNWKLFFICEFEIGKI